MLVLALSCSPSRGRNSDTMLHHFVAGMRELPGLEVQKIYLEDIYLEHYNFKNRTGPQPEERDFKKLADGLRQAVALVIATPTYNFSVPAQLKNFIDRIRFLALDLDSKNRLGQPVGKLGHLKTFFLVSGGTPTWAEKILFFAFPAFWLRGVFLYFGAVVLGAIYSGSIKTFENERLLAYCRRRGKKFGQMVLANKGNRFLERLFWRPPQIKGEE
jgi:FMN-dependent NADH-azoreductase